METQSEQLLIYDYTSYTTSSSYLVSHLYGRLAPTANALSSRGGLAVYHDDQSSYTNNGRGFLFEAHILGQ